MKLLTTLIIITLFVGAKAQNCSNPVSTIVFQQKFNEMATKPNDQQKFNYGVNFITGKCLTSNQVKLMASIFSQDIYRLEFCKPAFAQTMDQINFYDVYDSFSSFSAAFRLHDYVNGINNTPVPVVTEEPVDNEVEISFPQISYPNHVNYKGETGCDLPISEVKFMDKVEVLFTIQNDSKRADKAIELADENCMSMAQMMKMASTITSESSRLETMKELIYTSYDIENYAYAKAIFSSISNQNAWIKYCESEVIAPPCTTSSSEYTTMKNNLEKENFPDDRLIVAKQILNSHCLSVNQVKGFMEKFNFGDRRMQIAKAAYANCTDKGNYYQLASLFDFSSDKQAFNSWLSGQ